MKCEICKQPMVTTTYAPIHHFFNNRDDEKGEHSYEYYYDSTVKRYINEKGFMCLCNNCFDRQTLPIHQRNSLYPPKHIPYEQYKEYYLQLIMKGGKFGETV